MSELKVNLIQPATAATVTIVPSVEIKNTTGSVLLSVQENVVNVTSPVYVGSITDNSAGIAYTTKFDRTAPNNVTPQHLTSRGESLPPIWMEGVPFGAIIMWWGLPTNVPTGWKLCDGTATLVNGQNWQTPDLRDRFIVGAGGAYFAGSVGGYKDAVVVEHTHTTQPHSHTYNEGYMDYSERVDGDDDTFRASARPNIESSEAIVIVNSTGESGVDKNLPPYHALCFIMRVPTS